MKKDNARCVLAAAISCFPAFLIAPGREVPPPYVGGYRGYTLGNVLRGRLTRQYRGGMSVMVDDAIILLAEDNEDDVAMMRRAFKRANFLNPLYVVENGEQAIAYLKGEGKYASREEYPLPSLLLLDLKMPRKNGFDVLEWIRQEPGLGSLRVVVLTSSDEIRDVNRAYQLGANSFLVKPLDFSEFVRMTEALKGYWIWLSRSPEISRVPREARR